jgi:hypothetical protein
MAAATTAARAPAFVLAVVPAFVLAMVPALVAGTPAACRFCFVAGARTRPPS